MREHRALVDGSLVGHFLEIERQRLDEQDGAVDARGTAGRAFGEGGETLGDSCPHGRMRRHLRERGIVQVRAEAAARVLVSHGQHADGVAVVTGNHRVANVGGEVRDDLRA